MEQQDVQMTEEELRKEVKQEMEKELEEMAYTIKERLKGFAQEIRLEGRKELLVELSTQSEEQKKLLELKAAKGLKEMIFSTRDNKIWDYNDLQALETKQKKRVKIINIMNKLLFLTSQNPEEAIDAYITHMRNGLDHCDDYVDKKLLKLCNRRADYTIDKLQEGIMHCISRWIQLEIRIQKIIWKKVDNSVLKVKFNANFEEILNPIGEKFSFENCLISSLSELQKIKALSQNVIDGEILEIPTEKNFTYSDQLEKRELFTQAFQVGDNCLSKAKQLVKDRKNEDLKPMLEETTVELYADPTPDDHYGWYSH